MRRSLLLFAILVSAGAFALGACSANGPDGVRPAPHRPGPTTTTTTTKKTPGSAPPTESPAVTTYPAIQAAVQRLVGNVDDAMRAVVGSTDPTAAYANVAVVARSAASQLGSLTYPAGAQGDASALIAALGTMSSDAQQAGVPTTSGPGIPTTGAQADLFTVDTAEQRLLQDLG